MSTEELHENFFGYGLILKNFQNLYCPVYCRKDFFIKFNIGFNNRKFWNPHLSHGHNKKVSIPIYPRVPVTGISKSKFVPVIRGSRMTSLPLSQYFPDYYITNIVWANTCRFLSRKWSDICCSSVCSGRGHIFPAFPTIPRVFSEYTLQWRHNGHNGISNHQPYYCLLNLLYTGADERKHQSSASLVFVRRMYQWPVNSPHKWPVMWKMFPFDDIIMMYYHQTYWECFNWAAFHSLSFHVSWPFHSWY